MKYLIVVSLAITVCLAHYTPKQIEQIKALTEKCSTELGVSLGEEFLTATASGKDPFPAGDKQAKAFVTCFLTKTGVITPEGEVVKQRVLDFFSEGHNVVTLAETVDKCAAVKGDTLEDRAYDFHRCYWASKTE